MGRLGIALAVVLLAVSCGSATESTTTSGSSTPSTTTLPPTTARAPTTVTPSTLPPTTEPTTTTTLPSVEECLAVIPVEVKVGQLLFPVVVQSELDDAAAFVATGAIAGVVLVGDVGSGVELQLAELQAASLVGPSLIAVDEEGGRVQRVADLVGRFPSARDLASSTTPEEARLQAGAHAEKLSQLGFTMNLAPVLDLDTGTYIRDRSFSAEPAVVTEFGLAVAAGIADAGLTPVVKHFPGHGRGTDSHLGLPVLPEKAELEREDLIPFRAAVEAGLAIMVGHLVVPDLTGDEPASLSAAAITGWLRGELGFDGLVMTDAFNMEAIAATRSADEAAESTIAAGSDLAMLGRLSDVEETRQRLVEAIADERLDIAGVNRSFLRVLDAKGVSACDLPAEVAPAIRCDGASSGGCALVVG